MPSSADAVFKEAHKKEKGGFLGFGADMDAAQELYSKAGAQFKLQGDCIRAAESYTKAAECAKKLKNVFQVAESYQEAAHMYLQASSPLFESSMQLAVQALLENNRLGRAAELCLKSGDRYREMGMTEVAVKLYTQAEKYFKAENQKGKCAKCKQLQAEVYVAAGQYDKALPLYEAVGLSMLDGPLKFQAQEYLMKALYCRLTLVQPDNRLIQVEECMEQLSNYVERDVHLNGTREVEVFEMVLQAVRNEDIGAFEEAVQLLDDLKMLGEFKTNALLVIRDNIQSVL